jgi:flagellar P-ring protein precursor FlgI
MKSILISLAMLLTLVNTATVAAVAEEGIRLKELARLLNVRENSLIGYGLVTGLSGTGDSSKSKATTQSIANTLKNLGLTVPAGDINSRNVAAVIVATTLPAFSRAGDKLDVNVTSMGDAKSLLGGTLLLTHLNGADGKIYALAQGAVSVGGYKYDLNGNVTQKNHTTTGNVPNGAIVEIELDTKVINASGELEYKLHSPDFTTVQRVRERINESFGRGTARADDAGKLVVSVPDSYKNNLAGYITLLENLRIQPDTTARIVINERTGTVVSGGDVQIKDVTITHGDTKVSIVTDYVVSQPHLVRQTGTDVRTQVIPDTRIDVIEQKPIALSLQGTTSVADLVSALIKVKTSSRDVISILQAIKLAGALHAELVIQ